MECVTDCARGGEMVTVEIGEYNGAVEPRFSDYCNIDRKS